MSNTLFYGDNLQVLREYIADASVDLVYLDPPFNSNASYNVLFREKSGEDSPAQIKAFTDTWEWTLETERTFEQDIILHPGTPSAVKDMVTAFRQFIGQNAMMAYLVMMTPRLVELRRVLKPTGSLYLHCDPTASHYLKILLDTVFGAGTFLNEITWKRTSAHNSAKRFGPNADTILLYSKSESYTWNGVRQRLEQEYIDNFYRHHDDNGRYQLVDLTAPGVRHGDSGEPWREINPTEKGRHWAVPGQIVEIVCGQSSGNLTSQQKLDLLDSAGWIYWPPKGRIPRVKRYLDEGNSGMPAQAIWSDIPPISSHAKERLGYPTQKPEALLERIIQASSNEGDVVLDPFCGCGTAVAAAQKLNRQWLGIDVTHLAVALMKSRLKTAFNLDPGADYAVVGEPRDVGSARALWEQDPYQFQFWAVSLLEAQPQAEQKRGADRGIDGIIYFVDGPRRTPQKVVIQVKGGRVSSPQIRDLRGVVEREKAALGLFISLDDPTRDMRTEEAGGGFYHSDLWQQDYPKIQIRTIADLLADRGFDLPPRQPMYQPAERVRPAEGEQGAL